MSKLSGVSRCVSCRLKVPREPALGSDGRHGLCSWAEVLWKLDLLKMPFAIISKNIAGADSCNFSGFFWTAQLSHFSLFYLVFMPPPSLVGESGHTLLHRGGRSGFDPCQPRRTNRAFFPPLAI